MEKTWVALDRLPTRYSGQMYEQLSKRRNKDGTVTVRVKPLYHTSVTTGRA